LSVNFQICSKVGHTALFCRQLNRDGTSGSGWRERGGRGGKRGGAQGGNRGREMARGGAVADAPGYAFEIDGSGFS
jgi:hypothetical protein